MKKFITVVVILLLIVGVVYFLGENKDLINKANKIDLAHNKKQIKLKEFERIIESYKNTEVSPKKENKRKNYHGKKKSSPLRGEPSYDIDSFTRKAIGLKYEKKNSTQPKAPQKKTA